MHRVHDSAAAARAVDTARDGGLAAISIDLIFALPASLQRDWAADLDRALAMDPEHVSLYGLTVEPHTPLGRWSARGEIAESPEEQYEEEFLLAHTRLGNAGFEHYEVSNFAKPGKRAVHNSAYWRGVPYFAAGPSAHGFDGNERRWNLSAFAAWEAAIARGEDPIEGAETLTRENRIAEGVYLGLRTVEGLALLPKEQATVASWRNAGWVEFIDQADSGRVRCTPLGWMRLDRLAADLTALRSHS
jgi:oxygen-independent coproporphyrinogen-3 oxidase